MTPQTFLMQQSYLKSHLQNLCDAHRGKITPEIVLEDASDRSSPIHHLFAWDDSEAARQYRLLQAADLIRRVKVKVRIHDIELREVRAFVNVANPADDDLIDRKRVYVPIVEALRNPPTRRQVIDALHREAVEWEQRAKAYEIFASACKAIKQIKR